MTATPRVPAPVYLGDETSAAGYALAGVDARVPEPGAETAAFERARADSPLVIVAADVATRIDPRAWRAAVLALGCVVRGETRHYEQVADGCADGLMRVALDYRLPVLNGVLAVERHADAEARAGGAHGNKGEEVALAALEMADLWRQL